VRDDAEAAVAPPSSRERPRNEEHAHQSEAADENDPRRAQHRVANLTRGRAGALEGAASLSRRPAASPSFLGRPLLGLRRGALALVAVAVDAELLERRAASHPHHESSGDRGGEEVRESAAHESAGHHRRRRGSVDRSFAVTRVPRK
jgi:hypothetical protein